MSAYDDKVGLTKHRQCSVKFAAKKTSHLTNIEVTTLRQNIIMHSSRHEKHMYSWYAYETFFMIRTFTAVSSRHYWYFFQLATFSGSLLCLTALTNAPGFFFFLVFCWTKSFFFFNNPKSLLDINTVLFNNLFPYQNVIQDMPIVLQMYRIII